MKLDLILLAVLSMRPYSGYDLTKWFDLEGQFMRSNVHHSQIYRLLGKMVMQGLVEYTVHPGNGRPDAKVYRITDTGRSMLLDFARSPYQPTSRFQDPDFVCRLWIAGMIDTAATIALIDIELAYRTAQIAVTRGRSLRLDLDSPIPEIDPRRAQDITLRIHEQGKNAVDAWIDWLRTTRAELAHGLEGEDAR
jgi:DNA-binding PadR family transcriptional regulator